MAAFRLRGKVAIVTGGGRGLGRAYCRLLASRGAAVVVNDPGVLPRGTDPDVSVAAGVVSEIKADGGRGVASVDSVATAEGGQAIVDLALETFGRVDLFVHNAERVPLTPRSHLLGVFRHSSFAAQPIQEVMDMMAVHLLGAWHVGQPVWRDMEKRGSGRTVPSSRPLWRCSGSPITRATLPRSQVLLASGSRLLMRRSQGTRHQDASTPGLLLGSTAARSITLPCRRPGGRSYGM